MKINTGCFPGGKTKALTMSYDDGRKADEKLVGIFNQYGIKGTFHLNSALFDREDYVDASEIKELYKGHEISCHSAHHPWLERIPKNAVLTELISDKEALEKLAGYPVRGMSYPYGTYDADVINIAKTVGLEYSRTTKSTMGFNIPEDFMQWHPTCHHRDAIQMIDKFLNYDRGGLNLFYVWGHSYEFNYNNNWELIEEFCRKMSGKDDVWYATNIEIYDYFNAMKNIRMAVDCSSAYNPSAVDVWLSIDSMPVKIPAGEVVKLK